MKRRIKKSSHIPRVVFNNFRRGVRLQLGNRLNSVESSTIQTTWFIHGATYSIKSGAEQPFSDEEWSKRLDSRWRATSLFPFRCFI